jgi:hypothetical protein
VAENVRDLFQDQQDADRSEQSLDDAGREEHRNESGSGQPQSDLDHSRDDDRQQERRERAQRRDLSGHDRRQARRRAAHAGVRLADHPHQDSPDDAGDQPREQWRIRGQGNSQTQRQRDEKHDQSGREIARQSR